jgi:aryl-alcohol dehydrogenase-like predicted oxidoreductase
LTLLLLFEIFKILLLNQKIILGTVQLGVPYGINNIIGKPDVRQAYQILQEAQDIGIKLLDSADAYGDSLNVIGEFMKSSKTNSFEVISKFVGDHEKLEFKVDRTLRDIGRPRLYAYLYHRYSDYLSGIYALQIQGLKEKGKIDRIGVSLHSVDELIKVIHDSTIDLIQVPLNIFDSGAQKMDLLQVARNKGKEIHVRSVFLQGLFFKDPATLTGNLIGLRQPLQQLRDLIGHHDLDMRTICLSFVLNVPFVDRVIIGVDSKVQLIENLKSITSEFPRNLLDEIKAIPILDRALLNPSAWRQ